MKKRAKAASGPIPAAQYIRMSTEHQRFSPANQRAAIQEFARERGFEIVASYEDHGKSGLTMKGRPGLKALLRDVLEDEKPFRAILVLDVSRWGRFQDADQAAHYEYMCREAGAPVVYCGEAFDNDGSPMATLVKQMKRVMAAEYSRELSAKIARAQRQQARLGFKQGAPAVMGTRRQLVDESGQPRMILLPGQRKGISTDRVTFTHGPNREVEIVRLVFDLYVTADLKISEVAAELNRRRKKRPNGKRWDYSTVLMMLRNEIFTGTYVFGRVRNNLGDRTPVRVEDHVRASAMEPIISKELFEAAQAKRQRTKSLRLTNEELLEGLRRLAAEKEYITQGTIQECPYLPGPAVIYKRFGGLGKALDAIGYRKPYRTWVDGWRMSLTDDDLLNELRRIHAENGILNRATIDADRATPSADYFRQRLGCLWKVYSRLGVRKWQNSGIYRNNDGSPLTREWLIARLAIVLDRHGYLSHDVINGAPECPSSWFYCKVFGDLATAYGLVGFSADRSNIMKAAFARRRARLASS